MEKKLYWLVESNADLSITCNNLETCKELITHDFNELDRQEQEESQYTITPTFMTEEEYFKLTKAE